MLYFGGAGIHPRDRRRIFPLSPSPNGDSREMVSTRDPRPCPGTPDPPHLLCPFFFSFPFPFLPMSMFTPLCLCLPSCLCLPALVPCSLFLGILGDRLCRLGDMYISLFFDIQGGLGRFRGNSRAVSPSGMVWCCVVLWKADENGLGLSDGMSVYHDRTDRENVCVCVCVSHDSSRIVCMRMGCLWVWALG